MFRRVRKIAALAAIVLSFLCSCGGIPRTTEREKTTSPPLSAKGQTQPEEGPVLVLPPGIFPEKKMPPTEPGFEAKELFKKKREGRAHSLLAQNNLAAALIEWKILLLLDPENFEYKKQKFATEALIEKRVAQSLEAANKALERGDKDAAISNFLKVLALDPRRPEPLGRLRELESERALSVQLASIKRLADKRAAASAALEPMPEGAERLEILPKPHAPQDQDSEYLQTGIELFKAGDFESSIIEIQKFLDVYPDDETAKKYISEAHRGAAKVLNGEGFEEDAIENLEASLKFSRKPNQELEKEINDRKSAFARKLYEDGLRVQAEDLLKAIELWEKSLEYEPDNVQAKMRLKAAYVMRKNLRMLETSP